MRGVYLRVLLPILTVCGVLWGGSLSAQVLIPWASTWKYSIDAGDPGWPTWQNFGFDDSGWPEGLAPLGFPAAETVPQGLGPIQTVFPELPNPTQTVTYYRFKFNFAGNPSQVSLALTNHSDDGAVFFLNGNEVARWRMPAAPTPLDHSSLGLTGDEMTDRPNGEVAVFPGSGVLINGNNIMAVAVYQNGTGSSDVAFTSFLQAIPSFGPVNDNPNLPEDVDVVQGRSATLESDFSGLPLPTYQWFFDPGAGASPLLDETNATFTIGNMTSGDSGEYFVRATGTAGSVDSRRAFVGFLADLEAPVVVGVRWDTDSSVVIEFDEPVLDISNGGGADDPFGYSIAIVEGGAQIVVGDVTLGAGNTSVTLSSLTHQDSSPFTRDPAENYEVTIDSFYVCDAYFNCIDPAETHGIAAPRIVVAFDAVWHYNQAAIDLGPNWQAPPVDTAAAGWQQGQGLLGQETAGVTPPLIRTDLQSQGEGGPPTHYFVTRFFLDIPVENVVGIQISHYLDDAAAVYLNGQQAHLMRIGPNPGYGTQGIGGAVGDAALEGPFQMTGTLQAGENEIAVSVHTIGGNSSDVVWGAQIEILATQGPPPTPPTVRTHPLDAGVVQGESASFSVTATGQDPLRYQWQHEMSDLQDQTNATLVLNNVQPEDAGNYRVIVTNDLGMDTSDNAVLTVTPALTVLEFSDTWSFNQANVDLGDTWYTAPVNTTGVDWQSGPGLLGQETDGDSVPLINTDLMSHGEGGPPTHYFVTKFHVPVDPAGVQEFRLYYYLDDSAAVYINGTLAHLIRLDPNPTFASMGVGGAVGNASLEGPLVITGLVQGENEIAVSTHTIGDTSSDVVWGARIVAVGAVVDSPPEITSHPANVTVNEGATATFNVAAFGQAPLTYQWQRNMVNLPGETGPTLTIANAIPPDAGTYRVIVTNNLGTDTSDNATLTVIPQGGRPVLLWAWGSTNLAEVSLAFNEALNQASAQTLANYTVQLEGGGGGLAISSAVLVNGTNVVLTTAPRAAGQNYEVIVRDVIDTAFAMNVIDPNPTTAPILPTTTLVAISDTQLWRYDQTDVFPGANWMTAAFVDTAWPEGAALLAAETAPTLFPIRTVLTLLPEGGSVQTTTYYFRTRFNFSGDPSAVHLLLTPFIDDGAVFYLNGEEIFRLGMPAGEVLHTTFASRSFGDVAETADEVEGPYQLGPVSQLVAGENLLAVEVHQVNATSSDIVMGVQLDALLAGEPPPSLSIRRLANGDVEISWTAGPEWVLASSATVDGTYTPVAGNPQSPVVITPATGGRVFYQLVDN